jgi:4-amino-4-deoxy-L-arabinose transferase-like glycosyltransferase
MCTIKSPVPCTRGAGSPAAITAWLVLIVVFALLLRLISAANAPTPTRDAAEYLELAQQIASGNGYTLANGAPTAFRPPGYPAFLSTILRLPGARLGTVRVIECLIGAATCLLIYWIGRSAAGLHAGLLGAALWAVNPLALDTYFSVGTLNTETVASLCIPLCLWLTWGSVTRPTTGWSLGCGLSLGVTILTKSSLLLLPVFLCPLWLIHAWQVKSWAPVSRGAIAGALCCACVLGWCARNSRVFDEPVLISTNGGITFYRSNNPLSDGGHTYPSGTLARFQDGSEPQRSARFFEAGMRHLRENPGRIPWLAYRKMRMLMDPFYPSRRLSGRRSYNVWFAALAPLCLPAIVRDWKRHSWWIAVVAAALGELFLVTVLFHGYPRYRFPYEPLVALWAARGAIILWKSRTPLTLRLLLGGLYVAGHLVLFAQDWT